MHLYGYAGSNSNGGGQHMTTMFERYGGFGNVSKIVMAFYDKVLDSDIAGPYFENSDVRSLIDHQTKFIPRSWAGPSVTPMKNC